MNDALEEFGELIDAAGSLNVSIRMHGENAAKFVNWEKMAENFSRVFDEILVYTRGFEEEGGLEAEESFVYDEGY